MKSTKYKWLLYLNHCYLIAGLIVYSVCHFDSHLILSLIAGMAAILLIFPMKPMINVMDAGKPHRKTIIIDSILFSCFAVGILWGYFVENYAIPSVFLMVYVGIDLVYNLLKFMSYRKETGESFQ